MPVVSTSLCGAECMLSSLWVEQDVLPSMVAVHARTSKKVEQLLQIS